MCSCVVISFTLYHGQSRCDKMSQNSTRVVYLRLELALILLNFTIVLGAAALISI